MPLTPGYARARRAGRPTGTSAFRDVLRAGSSAGVRSRRRAAPFLLVFRRDRVLQHRPQERPALRDGALGHRDELVGQPVRRVPIAAGARGRPGRNRAARASGGGTDREKAYVAAVTTSSGTGDRRSADENRRVRESHGGAGRQYADDVEARIFYALALDQTALPTDKTYANQLKAAAFSKRSSRVNPTIRVSRTTSFTASTCRRSRRARSMPLDATRRSRPTRRTRSTCRRIRSRASGSGRNRSTRIWRRPRPRKDNATAEELHALDYQVYAYLQTAQDAAARRTRDAIGSPGPRRSQTGGAGNAAPPTAGYYALAAIPARYALERAAWAEAAALPARDAVCLGRRRHALRPRPRRRAKRQRRRSGARTSIDWSPSATRSQRPTTRTGPSRSRFSGARATAWVALAAGKPAEALTLMREAADQGRRHREVGGHARTDQAGSRASRRDADGAQASGRGARRVRDDADEGTESLPRIRRRPCRRRRRTGAKASAYYANPPEIAAARISRDEPSSPKRAKPRGNW